jgi:hypothetical protein
MLSASGSGIRTSSLERCAVIPPKRHPAISFQVHPETLAANERGRLVMLKTTAPNQMCASTL